MLRKYPFGYKMENGEFIADKNEKEVVINIFNLYLQGKSLQAIADKMSKQKIKYHKKSDTWNKNMVSRILQNENYIKNQKYPNIISQEIFDEVSSKRQKKGYTTERIDKVKPVKDFLICHKCGSKVKRRLKSNGEERWYCPNDKNHIGTKISDGIILVEIEIALSRYKIQKPTEIQPTDNSYAINLNREIENLIEQQNSNADLIKDMLMTLTAVRYNCCKNGVGEYERRVKILEEIKTHHNVLGDLHNTIEFDKDKLEKIIDKLILYDDGTVDIVERS